MTPESKPGPAEVKMSFIRGLCNLDTSWDSPALERVGNLDLSVNSMTSDITCFLSGSDLFLYLLLCRVNAEAKPRTFHQIPETTHAHRSFHKLSSGTENGQGQMLQLRMTS